jgi:hypothetical protein
MVLSTYRLGADDLSFWYDEWFEEGILAMLVPTVHIIDRYSL